MTDRSTAVNFFIFNKRSKRVISALSFLWLEKDKNIESSHVLVKAVGFHRITGMEQGVT